ncbi:MAG: alanine racemase, partial [Hyphomonas sp.]|nr:alanine racemase [Hyphomonas sp.]
WESHGWRDDQPLACAIYVDTGMNRLGLNPDILDKDGDALRKLAPVLVMSHLACADDPDSPMNAAQLKAFDAIAAAFPDTPSSLANSAGCYLGKAYGQDLTRPGIALYGGSHPPAGVSLRPAVTLEAEILSVFSAKAGSTVGYGATHTLGADVTLATVALGYADGILRAGSDKLSGWIDGVECPVLGRVSMDLITLDVSKAQQAAKAGARVEFLGPHAKLEAQAARAGTLGYELLTGLGPRVERVYQ